MTNKNQLSLFDVLEEQKQPVIKCRTCDIENTGRKKLVSDDDWIEWQADYMASALLMPKAVFTRIARDKFKSAGIEECYYVIGRDFEKDIWVDDLSYEIAELFDVSVTAARIRLKNLNFIRDINESQQCIII
ncbi:MAG: ImmA/IrrE family metallo-endopeptidase [Sedimentibacter sp.]